MNDIDFITGLYPLPVTIGEDMKEVRLMIDNRYTIVMARRVYSILKLHDYKSVVNAVIDEMIKACESGIIKSGQYNVFGKFRITQSHFTATGMISRLSYFTKPSIGSMSNSQFNYMHVGLREGTQYTRAEKLAYIHRAIKYKKNKDNRRYKLNITPDTKIDWEYCFGQPTAVPSPDLFSKMQINFYWSDIENIIYTHSIFGQAYCNAVRRVSKYSFDEDGNKLCSAYTEPAIPPTYVVFEEFTKILKKYYFEGNEIDFAIFVCYVKDHLSNNHPV